MDLPRPSPTSAVSVADKTEQSPHEGISPSSLNREPGISSNQKRQQWSSPSLEKVGSVAEATLQSFT
jgi:hypothetical protein